MSVYDVLYKILLVGDASSGKSCLIQRFAEDSFSEEYQITLGIDSKKKLMNIGDKKVKMIIYDADGKKMFRSVTMSYYSMAQGFMIVFDITNRKTFEEIEVFFREILKIMKGSCPIIIIGTHSDLYKEREVSGEEAMTKANKYGVMYIEVSSKTGDNVSIAFEIFIATILGIPPNCLF